MFYHRGCALADLPVFWKNLLCFITLQRNHAYELVSASLTLDDDNCKLYFINTGIKCLKGIFLTKGHVRKNICIWYLHLLKSDWDIQYTLSYHLTVTNRLACFYLQHASLIFFSLYSYFFCPHNFFFFFCSPFPLILWLEKCVFKNGCQQEGRLDLIQIHYFDWCGRNLPFTVDIRRFSYMLYGL